MKVKRTFKYRLYPSKIQQNTISEQLETARWLYNELLGIKIETYKHTNNNLSKYDLNKDLNYLKPYIRNDNLHSQVKQNISDRIIKAFQNMYGRIKRSEKAGFPRYKGKGRYKSICYPQLGYKVLPNHKLKVSKIGDINIKLHRPIKGVIKTMTITQTTTNKYYATFSCVVDTKDLQKKRLNKKKSVGLDVGLKHFMTTSEGEHIDNPKFFRNSETKLTRIQRIHSKRKIGSNNRHKSRLKVALCHEKVRHQRLDFIHKLSSYFVNNYSHIGIEDLNIKGMVQNHHLSKSINDVGWSMFYNQLQYKAEYADIEVTQVNTFYPSTKTCSKCGKLNKMPLKKRTYKCECGNIMDRDHNAAINIDNESLRLKHIGQELPELTPVEMVEYHRQ